MTYERPAVVEREAVGGPLIGVPTGSIPTPSPAWRRTTDQQDDADD